MKHASVISKQVPAKGLAIEGVLGKLADRQSGIGLLGNEKGDFFLGGTVHNTTDAG